ncbi:MAG: hypothetical protein H0U49_00165 [Parachlamydiaceae bacterium]|nr:hypothetical protein [Parachlamydiaceae bacterium]
MAVAIKVGSPCKSGSQATGAVGYANNNLLQWQRKALQFFLFEDIKFLLQFACVNRYIKSMINEPLQHSANSKTALGQWGRAWKADLISYITAIAILIVVPVVVFYFYIAAFYFNCELATPALGLFQGTLSFKDVWRMVPNFSWSAVGIVFCWIAFQAMLACIPDYLHRIIPSYKGGICSGAITPAGNRLKYNINGLQAWLISQILFVMAGIYFKWFSPTVIFDNWGGMLWVANIVGYSVAILVFIKAYASPSFPEDRKMSGNHLYDFFMGVELNPRIKNFDIKLFFNGRPGIVAWTLINLSFAAAQYQIHGTLTNSMLIVNFLQGLYVVYFFWKESWYLNTIDIHHDHFGSMLAWGDMVFLPYMYTLQCLYLVFNPIELSFSYAIFVLSLGLLGFWIFLSANNQKDRFRNTNGHAKILNKSPKFIRCQYTTKDGEHRESKLLLSGWWGVARHANYTGDLLLSLAYSLACGFTHFFPYFYFFFLLILLINRCMRDEYRCSNKYGEYWKQYCEQVPYRLIPRIW